MNEKKEPRPPVAQETGQVNNYSSSDYNTHNHGAQGIFSMLPQGEENAVSTKALVTMTGCGSARRLQHLIAVERGQGHLILSTCQNGGGYFLPADGEQGRREIGAFVATLRSRALNTLVALRAAQAALKEVEGQLTLDGLEELL